MSLIRFFICQCSIISHHAIHNQISKKRFGSYLNKKLQSSLPLRPGRNHAVVLCNGLWGNLLVLFWTLCQSVKGLRDIKYFKISTAHDVWFSRYRPSNMKLATDSAFRHLTLELSPHIYRYIHTYVLTALHIEVRKTSAMYVLKFCENALADPQIVIMMYPVMWTPFRPNLSAIMFPKKSPTMAPIPNTIIVISGRKLRSHTRSHCQ